MSNVIKNILTELFKSKNPRKNAPRIILFFTTGVSKGRQNSVNIRIQLIHAMDPLPTVTIVHIAETQK